MKVLLTSLLMALVVASAASAGSITLSVTTGAGSLNATANLSDTDIARIIAAFPPGPGENAAQAAMKQFLSQAIATATSVERQTAINNVPVPAPVCASVGSAILGCAPQ